MQLRGHDNKIIGRNYLLIMTGENKPVSETLLHNDCVSAAILNQNSHFRVIIAKLLGRVTFSFFKNAIKIG